MKLKKIISCLEALSPVAYAEDWDNVGLLLGDEEQEIQHIMVALDATDDVVEQAIEQNVDLLLTHHPMIFQARKQINTNSMIGRRIWKLATHQISCYAMHTNFDIKGGMAELAAARLDLLDTVPLQVTVQENGTSEGIGRVGILSEAMKVSEVAQVVKEKFGLKNAIIYGDAQKKVRNVAISPGSGKSEIRFALQAGVELLITGDIGHHEGIDAVDEGLIIMDATHYGLEHIFVEYIADYLKQHLTEAANKEAVQITPMDTGSPITVL